MNTMNTMPGFTAEASVYKTDGRYSVGGNRRCLLDQVVPQIP